MPYAMAEYRQRHDHINFKRMRVWSHNTHLEEEKKTVEPQFTTQQFINLFVRPANAAVEPSNEQWS